MEIIKKRAQGFEIVCKLLSYMIYIIIFIETSTRELPPSLSCYLVTPMKSECTRPQKVCMKAHLLSSYLNRTENGQKVLMDVMVRQMTMGSALRVLIRER